MTTFNTPMTVDELFVELVTNRQDLLAMILCHATAFYDDCDDGLREHATGVAWLALMEEEVSATTAEGMLEEMATLADCVLDEVWGLTPETRARLERIRDTDPAKNEDRQTETV
jgi:hypothetical protein